MNRWILAAAAALFLVCGTAEPAAAHDVQFGHGYGIANGDRMFYGPASGVEWRHRGPVRRTVCAVLRGGRNVATGNGPIARAWRSRRCSH